MPTRAGGHRDPRRIAQDSDPPGEKWLVAFRNPSSRSRPDSSLVREFLAPGFYEAYDIVMTFAERTNFEVLCSIMQNPYLAFTRTVGRNFALGTAWQNTRHSDTDSVN
jgi:hypothetical protein